MCGFTFPRFICADGQWVRYTVHRDPDGRLRVEPQAGGAVNDQAG